MPIKTTGSRPARMKPTSNSTPFATGVLLPAPVIAKIDRGIKALAVNYNLQGKLEIEMNLVEEKWTMRLLNSDLAENKPLVQITNKSYGGINKFLNECGRVLQKQYGQQEETERKQKRA